MNTRKNTNSIVSINNQGFSLIEILIAIVVFSFGLLGIAGLMTISIRSNHNGYMRSQAIIASNSITSSMRANVAGLWAGKYNTSATSAEQACDSTTHCDREQLAVYDVYQWRLMLAQVLPNGTGDITCETPSLPVGILSSGLWEATPPFAGTCTIEVSWSEVKSASSSAEVDAGGVASSIDKQVNVMVIQP